MGSGAKHWLFKQNLFVISNNTQASEFQNIKTKNNIKCVWPLAQSRMRLTSLSGKSKYFHVGITDQWYNSLEINQMLIVMENSKIRNFQRHFIIILDLYWVNGSL